MVAMLSKLSVKVMIAVVLVSLLLFSGCSNQTQQKSAAGSEPAGKQYDIIKVSTPNAASGTSLYYVGDELGFFAEEGLKMEYVGVIPSTQLVASVIAGKIDVGGAHVNRTIAGISAGAKIKAVAANTETTKDIPHMVFVALADSPIKTAQDLIGKKIGLSLSGGCHEYTPYAYLKKNGIADPKSKLHFTILAETLMEQALRQGDIEVAGMHKDPEYLRERGFKVVFSDYEIWGTDGGGTPAYFSEKFIQEKPDVVKRYVRAIAKSADWANANPQKAAEITAKLGNTDPKIVKEGHFAPHALITEESVTLWIDLLTEFGEIKAGMKPSQIYTNEFNPNAKK